MRYAELQCKTNYSFLRGASHPVELVHQAAHLGLEALAITDHDGVYGIPKAYKAAKDFPHLKLIVGAELSLEKRPGLILLAQDREAYGLLCRLLTQSHADQPKGEASLAWNDFLRLTQEKGHHGLIALPREGEGVDYAVLKEIFPQRLFIPVSRFLDGQDKARCERVLALGRQFALPLVATNDVHYHLPERKRLQDILTSIRENTPLSQLGSRLFSNAERYLKSPRQMHHLFVDLPEALHHSLEIAERCHFSPGELRYQYPSEWIPENESAQSYLERLVWEGARERYAGNIPTNVSQQLRHELALIAQLSFADYFLTIWEIVQFARERKILCQGRGSAANSAVCYCLGITAIDPVQMNLLFARFISVERGEPPDIDVDFEHERREEVIQHVYEKYGRHRAAMVAAVITYRSRSALRDLCRCLEINFDSWKQLPEESGDKKRVRFLAESLLDFPRHLSIHSGGFTLSALPLTEIVPVEPARMEERTIVQWDKYDLDDLGLLKVDILALGMLTALRKTFDLIDEHTLATLPADDPQTYAMIRRGDNLGMFQIESRAQINMSQRLLPTSYYDLVVQVALVRPGPIVGKMVHPYLRRRQGLEEITLPDPRLRPILERTLGVPIFQEQIMKIAMVLAKFTPGEADQLRKAIGAWRSSGSIEIMGEKLRRGLLASGLPRDYVNLIFEQLKGFAEYGFPESHSASFALLAYASAYLKCHHPAAFVTALINSQPMGFYAVHSLIDDAKRHGVRFLPVDPNCSQWECTLEEGAVRLGWRLVRHIHHREVEGILQERQKRPFRDVSDFIMRTALRSVILEQMAMGDAFGSMGYDQRQALWEVLRCEALRLHQGSQRNLFQDLPGASPMPGLFPDLNRLEVISKDYESYGVSIRAHPLEVLRQHLRYKNVSQTRLTPAGKNVSVAGMAIVRQRPPTAKGTVFASLEDETGILDLILHQKTFERYEKIFLEHAFLVAQGKIQRDREAVSLLVHSLKPLLAEPPALEAQIKAHEWH